MPTPDPARDSFAIVAKRAAIWLLFLAPFFYLTYGFANWLASQRDYVGHIVFDWERSVPFMAWTILPYWSINAFYALSLFLNDNRAGVDRLAGRYLTAQLVAVCCFIAFPLTATFIRPETDGLPGFMFDVLVGFDKPFNQAPSLHIALTVIIWDHLRHRLSGVLALAWHVWCLLIAFSVLTTFQHHFIDIPTGALLGLFALWLFPRENALPFAGFKFTGDVKRRRIGGYYAAGSLLCLLGAVVGSSPLWLTLIWPSLALAIVAFGYFGAGIAIFQKGPDGRTTRASALLILPYRIGARINAFAWTRGMGSSTEIADGVFLGRSPRTGELPEFACVVDLAAELTRPAKVNPSWVSVPMLDLVAPAATELEAAAQAIEAARRAAGPNAKILVCCALGFQRSASAIARWLVLSGRVADEAAAEAMLLKSGRRVVLHAAAGKPAAAET